MRRDCIGVNRCYLCKQAAESCSHLLEWWLMTSNLWSIVYNLIRISWIIAGSVKEEIWAWENLCKQQNYSFNDFWVIWKKRNNRVIKGIENDIHKLWIDSFIILSKVFWAMIYIGMMILGT